MVLSGLTHGALMRGISQVGVLLAIALSVSGCGQKAADSKIQASKLEQAVGPANQAAPGSSQWYVNAALTAVRSNDYVGSVALLQNAVRVPGLTAEQLMAVQDTRRAIVTELVNRAGAGDEKAKAALAAIQNTH